MTYDKVPGPETAIPGRAFHFGVLCAAARAEVAGYTGSKNLRGVPVRAHKYFTPPPNGRHYTKGYRSSNVPAKSVKKNRALNVGSHRISQ